MYRAAQQQNVIDVIRILHDAMDLVRHTPHTGKAFTRVKFTVSKSAKRDDRDLVLQGKAKRARSFAAPPLPFETNYQPTDEVLERLRTLAPGWDRHGWLGRALWRLDARQAGTAEPTRRFSWMG